MMTLYETIREKVNPDVDRTSLYRLQQTDPKRPDVATLAAILDGLELITGKQFTLTDLMDFDREGE